MAAAKPTRKKPDFTGVPGKIVQAPAGLIFGEKKRHSPYDALLTDLSGAAKGSVLHFTDPRARASVTARAKKLGMKVLFAESGGALYVQFAGWFPDSERWKALARAGVLDVIQTQPRSEIQIATALRAKGLTDIDAGTVGGNSEADGTGRRSAARPRRFVVVQVILKL